VGPVGGDQWQMNGNVLRVVCSGWVCLVVRCVRGCRYEESMEMEIGV
jgi:hypothetical protein